MKVSAGEGQKIATSTLETSEEPDLIGFALTF